MQTLFPLWALTGILTALIIPHPLSPSPPPSSSTLQSRGASLPTLENYTATYLSKHAIRPPPCAPSTLLSRSVFPNSKTPNATQCRLDCERLPSCHFFNVYTLFRADENLGMQCVMFDRRWTNDFATEDGSGDLDLVVLGTKVVGGLEISNSVAYWRSGDEGGKGCGGGVVTGFSIAATPVSLSIAMGRPFVGSTSVSTTAIVPWTGIGRLNPPLPARFSMGKVGSTTVRTSTFRTQTVVVKKKMTTTTKTKTTATSTVKVLSVRGVGPLWGARGSMPVYGPFREEEYSVEDGRDGL